MSYTFLVASGEESWAASFSDIPASVLSRLNLTEEKSCSNGNEMESCQDSPSGTTLQPSMANHGVEKSISCAEGFPVRTSASPPTQKQELPAREVDSGLKCHEWFAKLDPVSFSWKTPQLCLFEESKPFSVIWPK